MIPTELRDQLTTRLRQRAENLFPGQPVAVTFDDDAEREPSPARTILATVRDASRPEPTGLTLADRRPATRSAPLHGFLDAVTPGLGSLFRPTGLFHHVGGRPCATPLPGFVEEIWVHSDIPITSPSTPRTRFLLNAATVGPVGHFPVVGATAASAIPPLAAGILALALPWPAVLALIALLAVATTILCVLAEPVATRHFLDPDAREFVLDEVAGAALAVCFVPADHIALGLLLAFGAFRLFDVLKPGIQWIERRPWRGKVAWDDLIAGLYAGLLVALVFFLV
ncbi:MAG: phosphatidylglycerophosphatase A [Chthoniobacterales bacterium]